MKNDFAKNTETNSKYKFKFSIICAVYNVGNYVEDTIKSIICQDIGFEENVQLILVDDCSKDNSFEICQQYAKLYPNNIIAKQLPQNSGNASEPRNTAMKYVEGKYINCTDSDDLLTPNTLSLVWNFFEEHEEEVDMVAIPLDLFYNNDVNNVVHSKRNTFIKNKSRVVDLEEEWRCTISSVATVFCHARNKHFFKFDPTIINGEDLMVANKILLQKKKLGLVAGCTYLYRQHVKTDTQESLIQQGQKKPSWYTHSIKRITMDMLDYALENYGTIPRFYQFALAADLQWRMIVRNKTKGMFNDEELDEFYKVLIDAFVRFDYSIITTLPNLPITEKIYILRKKYSKGIANLESKVDTDLFVNYPPTVHLIELKRYSDGTVEFIGDYNDILHKSQFTLCATFGTNVPVKVKLLDQQITNYIHKDVLYVKKYFSVKFKLSDIPFYSALSFYYQNENERIKAAMSTIDKFPMNSDYSGNYYFIDDFVLSYYKNTIRFDKKKIYSPITCEARYIKSIFKKTSDNKLKILVHRLLFKLLAPIYKKKTIWLVSDKADRADDNGEFFFRYLTKNKRKKDKCYFVISKSSKDCKAMKKHGKCIDYLSYKHKILSMFATYLVSAHTHDDFRKPLGIYHKYMADAICNNNFIFLQHGIIKSDQSRVLNRGNMNIDMFVTSSRDEQESIINGNYGYNAKSIQLCGMSRYDGLYSQTEKLITIAPTWRYNLCGVMDPRTDTYSLSNDFDDSLYYQFFKALLTDERLMSAAKKKGYKIQFLPHPILFPHKEKFEVNPEIKVLGYGTSFKEVYAKSALMVTDYSSLVFDFAYLNKPIIYTLFDYDHPSNAYSATGYYDHEKDGLGDVVYTLDDTVNCIIEYMNNDCQIKKMYLKRINNFFVFKDKNNAKRVFNSILKLESQEFFGIK